MGWEHLSDTTPRARKTYRCFLCGEAIEIGEVHVRRSGVMDNDLISTRMHTECEAATTDWDETDWECTSEGDMDRPKKVEVADGSNVPAS